VANTLPKEKRKEKPKGASIERGVSREEHTSFRLPVEIECLKERSEPNI